MRGVDFGEYDQPVKMLFRACVPTSCSGGAQACKEAIGRARAGTQVTPSQCDAAAAQCMKTGVFVGPGTGTRRPVEKK
jgi:hypothetical protein